MKNIRYGCFFEERDWVILRDSFAPKTTSLHLLSDGTWGEHGECGIVPQTAMRFQSRSDAERHVRDMMAVNG